MITTAIAVAIVAGVIAAEAALLVRDRIEARRALRTIESCRSNRPPPLRTLHGPAE